MNKHKFTIQHNSIQDGSFPIEQLNSYGVMNITERTISTFIKEYEIEMILENDDDPLSAAYHLGKLVSTLLRDK